VRQAPKATRGTLLGAISLQRAAWRDAACASLALPVVYTEHLSIPVGPGSLHAERNGRGGPPILLVHGFGSCAFLWRGIAPRLARAGYTAVAIDLLGHGESDSPADAAYGLGAQAAYLERALTALRIPSASVVGQDVGALVAMLLAASRPNRVQRLALLSAPDPHDLPGAAIRAMQRVSARAALGANSLFGAQPLLEPLLEGAVADPAHMPAALRSRYLAPFVGGDGVTRLLQLASAVELLEEELAQLRDVRCPTLLLNGLADDSDTATGVTVIASTLGEQRATARTVPGAGRLIAEDAPELLIRLLLDWMAEPPGQPARQM
jgi:pimeloyl-ACP methyl ester carboxylesterase